MSADMHAATDEIRGGDEALDPGEGLEKKHELTTVQFTEHFSQQRWKPGLVVLVAPAIVLVVAHHPGDFVRAGKAAESERARSTGTKSSRTICGKGSACCYLAALSIASRP